MNGYDIGNEEAGRDAAGEYEYMRQSAPELTAALEAANKEWLDAVMNGGTSAQVMAAKAKRDEALTALAIAGFIEL